MRLKARSLVIISATSFVGLTATSKVLATDYVLNQLNAAWTDPGAWTPAGVPTAGSDNAYIGAPGGAATPVTVVLGTGFSRSVGTLKIAPSTGNASTLTLSQSSTLGIYTALNNDGVIQFAGVNANPTKIVLFNDLTFAGSGRVSLNAGGGNTQIVGSTSDRLLTNAAPHTIDGAGSLGLNLLNLVNQGTVKANVSGATLLVDPTSTAVNRGMLTAVGGGTLALGAAAYDNTGGGLIVADGAGSFVDFRTGASITGGTIRGINGGIARAPVGFSSVFTNVRFEGAINGEQSSTIGVSGSIVNAGTITLQTANANPTRIDVQAGGATFSGGGTVVLGGTGNGGGITGISNATLTNAADHTIEGRGSFGQDLIGIVNAGTIRATLSGQMLAVNPSASTLGTGGDAGLVNTGTLGATAGATLRLDAAQYENAGGLIVASGTNALVSLADGALIRHGTITSNSGGLVQAAAGAHVVLQDLTLSGSMNALSLADVGVSGTINNLATITLSASTTNPVNLDVQAGGAILNGDGTLVLGGPGSGAGVTGVAGLPTLTNSATHRIEGKGALGRDAIGIINHGIIAGNNPTQALELDPANGADVDDTGNDLDNFGTLRAESGGTLAFKSGTYRNRNTIVADGTGSLVLMRDGAILRGGTLAGVNGGTFAVDGGAATAQWENVTFSGGASIPSGSKLVLNGTFVNGGTVTVAAGSTTATNVTLLDNITLSGSGSIVLGGAGAGAGINSDTPDVQTLTNGPTHTITGKGNIGRNTIGIVNNGTIVATDAVTALEIDPGVAGFVNNATLRAQGAAGLQLDGGVHQLTSGSTLTIDAGSKLTVANAATLTLRSGATLNQNAGADFIVNTSGTFVNEGNYDPGTPAGTAKLTMTGNFTNAAAGTLGIQLGGTTPGMQFDQIAGSGSATLAGTLDLQLVGGFDPALYSPAIVIIDDTSGSNITGRFQKVLHTGTGPKRLAVVYRQLSGTIAGEVVVVAAVPGDADVNGKVDFADLVTLAQNYNQSGKSWQTGDFNGEGDTNFADLVALAQNYNYGTAIASNSKMMWSATFAADWALAQSLVPEPAAIGVASLALMLVRRRL